MKKFLMTFAAGAVAGGIMTVASASVLGSSVFSDVPTNAYYNKAVGELSAAGIVKGNNGRFMPGDFVTRADVAVMMARLRAELRGESWTDTVSVNDASSSSRVRSSSSKSSESSSSSSSVSSSSSSSSSYNPKGVFRFATANFTVQEINGKANITIVRTGGNEGTVAITYAVAAGTAKAGEDFTTASGTVTLSNKETSKSITVTVADDLLGEGDETFTVTLSNPQNGVGLGTPSTATVTIKDNETSSTSSSSTGTAASSSSGPAAGTFNFGATAYAMNEKGGSITITVLRSGGSTGTANVNYATANGTATSGTDYAATNGTLSFAAGETSKSFTVSTTNNENTTGNKVFNLVLSGQTGGAALGVTKQAAVTIFDDESNTFGSGALKFSAANYDVQQSAGTVLVTIVRAGGANGTINVDYFTSNGSAFTGVDYTSTSGTMTFAPGEASKTFSVPIIKNTGMGDARTVNLGLTNNTATTTLVNPYNATITIQH